jgi:hypothetical protein
MRSQIPPYPSFTWVLTDQPNSPVAPMHFHPCALRPYITQPRPNHDLMVINIVQFSSRLLYFIHRTQWVIERKDLLRLRCCLRYADIDMFCARLSSLQLPVRAIQDREATILNLEQAITSPNTLEHRIRKLPSLSALVVVSCSPNLFERA